MAGLKLSMEKKDIEKLFKELDVLFDNFRESSSCLYSECENIVQKSKNERFYRMFHDIFSNYNESVRKMSRSMLEEWSHSPESLDAIVKKFHSGDQAEATAKKIKTRLKELSSCSYEFPEIKPPVTGYARLDSEYYTIAEKAFSDYSRRLQDSDAENNKVIRRLSDENILFRCLTPVSSVLCRISSNFAAATGKAIASEKNAFDYSIQNDQKALDETNRIMERNAAAGGRPVTEKDSDLQNPGSTISSATVGNSAESAASTESPLNDYIVNYIIKKVLGNTSLYERSLWYRTESRKKEWENHESGRRKQRDKFIAEMVEKMPVADKEDWKSVIEKSSQPGENGYKTEQEYLAILNESMIFNAVEKARLWQGSYSVKTITGNYQGRDNYTLDKLDRDTYLYALSAEEEECSAGNYFISEDTYNSLKDKEIDEIYSILQMSHFYNSMKDHIDSGYKRYFKQYVLTVATEVARGVIEANPQFNETVTKVKVEQIFIPYPDNESGKIREITVESTAKEDSASAKHAEAYGKLESYARRILIPDERRNYDVWVELTQYIYNTISNESSDKTKSLSYDIIKKLMNLYDRFYKDLGIYLKDTSSMSAAQSREYKNREYIGVLEERKNFEFFLSDAEKWTFFSHYSDYNNYFVFYTISHMLSIICDHCLDKKADDINLMYAAYVLFDPILHNAYLPKENDSDYARFSEWAGHELLKIVEDCRNPGSVAPQTFPTTDKAVKVESNFSRPAAPEADTVCQNTSYGFTPEQGEFLSRAVEYVVNRVVGGTEKLNRLVEEQNDRIEECYHILTSYSSVLKTMKAQDERDQTETNPSLQPGPSVDKATENTTYGKYTVTNTSIRMVQCAIRECISPRLDKLDDHYARMYRTIENQNGYQQLMKTIELVEKCFQLVPSNSAELGGKNEKEWVRILLQIPFFEMMQKKISTPVEILDIALKFGERFTIFTKIKRSFWKLVDKARQLDPLDRYLDQYMSEHYYLVDKNDLLRHTNSSFSILHNALKSEEKTKRRAFENAALAGDACENYYFRRKNPAFSKEFFNASSGLLLNLARAGLAENEVITSEEANHFVDKLYIGKQKCSFSPILNIDPLSDNKYYYCVCNGQAFLYHNG